MEEEEKEEGKREVRVRGSPRGWWEEEEEEGGGNQADKTSQNWGWLYLEVAVLPPWFLGEDLHKEMGLHLCARQTLNELAREKLH